jgi:radial spoke head protein 4A
VVVLNSDFEWPGLETLMSPENWVHHMPFLLPQGRTVWANPFPPTEQQEREPEEGDEEEGDQEEEGANNENSEENGEVEPETGPSILTPVSDDARKYLQQHRHLIVYKSQKLGIQKQIVLLLY